MIKHLAYSVPFNILYDQLKKAEVNNYVYRRQHPIHQELTLWCYTKQCVIDKAWDLATLSARGLILHIKQERIVSVGFPKFFNLEEVKDVPAGPFIAQEKCDGSLIHTFFYDGEWIHHTKGCWNHENALVAKKLWYESKIDPMWKGCTFLFELISPESKVVVNYGDKRQLIHITTFNKNTGSEYYPPLNPEVTGFTHPNFGYPKTHSAQSISELNLETPNFEGYVLRYNCGTRIKIKTEEYVRLHRMISNISHNRILENLQLGLTLESIKSSLPEQFAEDIESLGRPILKKIESIWDEAKFFYDDNQKLSRKDYAIKGKAVLNGQSFGATMLLYSGKDEEFVRKAILKGMK